MSESNNTTNNITDETKKELYDVVVYIDGSAIPNPGNMGSGIYGYMFKSNEIVEKHNTGLKTCATTNYGFYPKNYSTFKPTDAIHLVNPVYYIHGYVSYPNTGTNDQAEVKVFKELVDFLTSIEATTLDLKLNTLRIKSDSNYFLHICDKITTTPKSTWEPAIKTNEDLWYEVESTIAKLKEHNISVEFLKVKGHSESLGNHYADRLALIGNEVSKTGKYGANIRLVPARGYWKRSDVEHPFLKTKQLFFISGDYKINNKTTYAIMNYDSKVEVGVKTADASFGLIMLKEEPYLVKDIIDFYNKRLGTLSIISTVNLNNAYSQNTQVQYNLFGSDIFTYDNKRAIVNVWDEYSVARAIKPAGLATHAYNAVMGLGIILKEYLDNKPTLRRKFIDVTDQFYEHDEKGKVKIKLPNGTNLLDVKFNMFDREIKVPLDLGRDMLNRNILKRLEKLEPKIILAITDMSDNKTKYIEYHIIIELKTGDIGIWCNLFSNGTYIK